MSVLVIDNRVERCVRFHETGWGHALSLAQQNGWSPGGVTPCQPLDCLEDLHIPGFNLIPLQNGGGMPIAEGLEATRNFLAKIQAPVRAAPHGASYFDCKAGQVTAKDAAALGKALRRALPDIPGHDALRSKTFTSHHSPGRRQFHLDTPINASEWFSGPKRKVLKGFIALCGLGGFVIQRR